MNIQYADALRETLARHTQETTREIDALTAAGRADEANIQKAVRNIYGICDTLLNVSPVPAEYAAQLDKLRGAWQQAREMAQAHGDFSRVAMEDAKLAALRLVDARFIALTGEATAHD